MKIYVKVNKDLHRQTFFNFDIGILPICMSIESKSVFFDQEADQQGTFGCGPLLL